MPKELLLLFQGGRVVVKNPETGDTIPPELISITLFPAVVDKSGPQTVRVEFQLKDRS